MGRRESTGHWPLMKAKDTRTKVSRSSSSDEEGQVYLEKDAVSKSAVKETEAEVSSTEEAGEVR